MPQPQQDPNRAPLGLGLGLAPQGRAGFRNAAAGGNLDRFLGNHPRADRRFQRNVAGDKPQGAQGNAGATPAAPSGSGPKGGPQGNAGAPQGTMAAPPQLSPPPAPAAAPAMPAAPVAPAPAAPPQTFDQYNQSMYGAGNPFGMRPGAYSDPNNPMYGAAKSNLDQALAGIRARYAGSGLGHSGRESLAEGQAAGDFANQVAQLGESAYQNDASRALSGTLGGQQNQLALNQQLSGLGTALTGIGAQEQTPAGLAGIMGLISQLLGQSGSNTSNTSGKTGWYGG